MKRFVSSSAHLLEGRDGKGTVGIERLRFMPDKVRAAELESFQDKR